MKFILIIILIIVLTVSAYAKVVGEVTDVREVTKGLINITVVYKDGDKVLEDENYTIANSDTAIDAFQREKLPQELARVEAKNKAGGYVIKAETIKSMKKGIKTYSIKIGDKVE